jgi:hypothetical protein
MGGDQADVAEQGARRGSSPASCPAKPLVSYRINRQFSGWNLPPLMIRAFGAHGQYATCHQMRVTHRTHIEAETFLIFHSLVVRLRNFLAAHPPTVRGVRPPSPAAPLTALASAGTKPEAHRKQVGGPSLIGNKDNPRWPRLPASMRRNRLLAACRRASALCRRPVQCPHRRVSRT